MLDEIIRQAIFDGAKLLKADILILEKNEEFLLTYQVEDLIDMRKNLKALHTTYEYYTPFLERVEI